MLSPHGMLLGFVLNCSSSSFDSQVGESSPSLSARAVDIIDMTGLDFERRRTHCRLDTKGHAGRFAQNSQGPNRLRT